MCSLFIHVSVFIHQRQSTTYKIVPHSVCDIIFIYFLYQIRLPQICCLAITNMYIFFSSIVGIWNWSVILSFPLDTCNYTRSSTRSGSRTLNLASSYSWSSIQSDSFSKSFSTSLLISLKDGRFGGNMSQHRTIRAYLQQDKSIRKKCPAKSKEHNKGKMFLPLKLEEVEKQKAERERERDLLTILVCNEEDETAIFPSLLWK